MGERWKRSVATVRDFFQEKWNWLIGRLRAMTKKQIALGIVLSLLVISPTVGAWIYVIGADHGDNTESLSVSLYDADGKLIGEETKDPHTATSSSLTGIFYDILTHLEATSTPLGDPQTDRFVRARLNLNGAETEFQCFFSLEEGKSYCLDASGKSYIIRNDSARRFLATVYAQGFYDLAVAPSLVTIDGDTILPSSSNWLYQNIKGDFIQATNAPYTEEVRSYDIAGEVGIHFDKTPDLCHVLVYQEDQKIYDGNLSGLPYLTVKTGSMLHITVRAEWFSSGNRGCYGSADYDFEVMIKNPARFAISRDTVAPGEFVILSCQNVSDPNKILFTSSQTVTPPVFHRDGDLYRAFLPIPEDFTENRLSFELSYGASSHRFSLNVQEASNQKEFELPNLELGSDASLNARIRHEWEALVRAARYDAKTPFYFQGNFKNPLTMGFTASYEHGDKVLYGEAIYGSFVAMGSEFLTQGATGIDVGVWNHGRVIYTGSSELFGQVVVVDHGGGLRTWYCHLSDVSVSVGDVLQGGETVGKSGSSGLLASADGYAVICTVYDVLVPPSTLMGASLDPS